MKRFKFLLLILLFALMLTGCTRTEEPTSKHKTTSLTGYMMLDGNKLYLDEVEILTTEDEDRLAELGLTAADDLPNGYYIYNPDQETAVFELTHDTTYIFTDSGLLFSTETNGNKIYGTTSKQKFLEASSYQAVPLEEQKIPYLINVYEGKVASITEELIYTQ